LSSCRTVACRPCVGASGTYDVMSSSSRTFPASTSCSTTAASMFFEIEAM
jgi:hypothetical protein